MIKLTQRVEFDCDHSGASYDLESIEFSDDSGNVVAVNFRHAEETINLSYKILFRAMRLDQGNERTAICRSELIDLVGKATEYLEATKPVDAEA